MEGNLYRAQFKSSSKSDTMEVKSIHRCFTVSPITCVHENVVSQHFEFRIFQCFKFMLCSWSIAFIVLSNTDSLFCSFFFNFISRVYIDSFKLPFFIHKTKTSNWLVIDYKNVTLLRQSQSCLSSLLLFLFLSKMIWVASLITFIFSCGQFCDKHLKC